MKPERAGFAPRRVVVVVTRQIGDVLLTTPLIAAARARWPDASIDVLGAAGTLDILAGNPLVDARVEVGRARSLRERLSLVRRLWRRWDLAVVAEVSDRAHLLGWLAAPRRFGLLPRSRGGGDASALRPDVHAWWKRLWLDEYVVADVPGRHVSDEKLLLVGEMAGRVAPSPPAARALPPDVERDLEAAPVVVHVPSMWRYKQWPVESFRTLVAGLLERGHQVVLTGGPAAGDRDKVATVASLAEAPRLIDACGRLDFGQLAGLLARAALYIGPDTSVTHLAAATGIPVIALFGPTDPTRWGPIAGLGPTAPFVRGSEAPQRRGTVVLMQGPGLCVPCGRAGCENTDDSVSACLVALSPDRVLAEAVRVLEAAACSRPPSSTLAR